MKVDFAEKITSEIKAQLKEIVKATQDATNATKKMSSSAAGSSSGVGKQAKADAQNINRLTSLYKQLYSIKVKLQATDPKSNKSTVLNAQAGDIEKQIRSIENLNKTYSQHKKVLDAVNDGKRKLDVAKASARDQKEATVSSKRAQTDAQNIKQLVSLYKQYYSIQAKLQSVAPNSEKAATLTSQANDIQKQIQSIEALNQKYSKHKKVLDAVREGKKKLEVAKANAQDQKEAAALKEKNRILKEAEDARDQQAKASCQGTPFDPDGTSPLASQVCNSFNHVVIDSSKRINHLILTHTSNPSLIR